METLNQSASAVAYLVLISALAVFVVYRVLRRLKTKTPKKDALEIQTQDLGEFRYSQLILVSLLSLLVEMLMIRWVSSDIRIFAYFKNYVLIACFLGFGLGCYSCRKPVQVRALISALLLLTIILKAPISPLHNSIAALPQMLGASVEVHVWGVPTMPTSWKAIFLAMAFIVSLFSVIAIAFVPFGQLVGWYLENAPRGVTAYSINVLASLAGIAAFTLLSFLCQPPWVWFLVVGVLSLIFLRKNVSARNAIGVTLLVCLCLLAIPDYRYASTYWSPYQKLTIQSLYNNGKIEAYSLTTNDSLYQMILNLSPEFVQEHAEVFSKHPLDQNAYNMPYRFYPSPPSVLVLGSGMGNDVAAALRNGAGRVEAVEIDPLILKLGKQLHFEHPYQSPRVRVILNDARNYIENTHEKFDLILFSLLDSHTTTSHFTNIRIDNYVYTREAFKQAKELLKPDGLFVVKFQVDTPWIAGRLYELMQATFHQNPIQFQTDVGGYDMSGRFFVAGSPERLAVATSDGALGVYLASHGNMPMQHATLTSDDWPYFYQHEPGLPLIVILVSVAVLIVFGWFLRQTSGEGGRVNLHFMFLGAGFMLLEAQIVSRMALLFGTTWVVNAVVVSGLLCLIVGANLVYGAFRRIPLWVSYAGLFLSLAIMFAVPLDKLFYESWAMRAVAATLVLCMPVFFAGIIFISSFARSGFRGSMLGSNLFGSLLGGLLESSSLWFGLKFVTILAAVFYVASAIFLRLGSELETDDRGLRVSDCAPGVAQSHEI
jgi:SAM-dependent methyltransferase